MDGDQIVKMKDPTPDPGERFPADFMFPLNNQEVVRLRCQNGTSKMKRGGSRYLPYAFTAGCGHVIGRVDQSQGDKSQHRNHAGLCQGKSTIGFT